jgi:hypothetical protein
MALRCSALPGGRSGADGRAGLGWARGDAPASASGPRLVEAEQAGKDFVVGERPGAEVLAPAIGVGNRFIDRVVRMGQPGRARIVEVGEGALRGTELFLEFGTDDFDPQVSICVR